MPKKAPKNTKSPASPEYGELIKFLGKKFDGIDKRFTLIDKKLAINDKQFIAIDHRFDAIEKTLETKADKSDIDRVMNVLDVLMGKFDDQRTEQLMMKHDLARHERWHKQTAEKIGLKLEP